jgi:hypothetical protein
MEWRDKPDLNVSEYCEKHDTNKIIAWCSSHEIGVCTLCQKMDHAECNGVESLTELRNVSELSAEFKSLKRQFTNIKTIYRSLQEERRSNIESLQLQKIQIRENIHNLREHLNNLLIELENRLLDELERTYTTYRMKLEDEVTEYKHKTAILGRYDEDLEKTKEYGTHLQIILAAREAMTLSRREETYLQNINEIIQNFSIELKISDTINNITNIPTMGVIGKVESNAYVDIDILKQKTFLPKIKHEKSVIKLENTDDSRWDRTRLKRDKEFNMNTTLNKFLPEVLGAVFLSDESIILADAAHKRLLHFKDAGQIFKEIPLSYVPFDVGILGNSRLYISIANDRRVDVRDVGSMKQIDELILPSNVSGINCYCDSLLVVACEKTGLYLLGNNNSVNIIPMRHNEEGPVDVCADRICYAETKKCLVHSFTHDGKRKFTVKVEGIGYIHGVALLKDSSVLVAKLSPGRHSIVHISQDGKEKMLRLELNEIAAPRIFAVHRTKRKILLVHGVRKMSIFKEL